MNPRTSFDAYRISNPNPSATWVHLHMILPHRAKGTSRIIAGCPKKSKPFLWCNHSKSIFFPQLENFAHISGMGCGSAPAFPQGHMRTVKTMLPMLPARRVRPPGRTAGRQSQFAGNGQKTAAIPVTRTHGSALAMGKSSPSYLNVEQEPPLPEWYHPSLNRNGPARRLPGN